MGCICPESRKKVRTEIPNGDYWQSQAKLHLSNKPPTNLRNLEQQGFLSGSCCGPWRVRRDPRWASQKGPDFFLQRIVSRRLRNQVWASPSLPYAPQGPVLIQSWCRCHWGWFSETDRLTQAKWNWLEGQGLHRMEGSQLSNRPACSLHGCPRAGPANRQPLEWENSYSSRPFSLL